MNTDFLNKKSFSAEVGGKTLTIETSILGEQASGAVIVTYGDTVVLGTATMGSQDRAGIDYFPLTVDYEEKFYAAGKIIGSRFIRRESRPSDEAILNGRLVDRSLRPLFDQRLRRDVQVIITILSIDEHNDPDFVGLIAASAALAISDIPWGGPIAGVRMAKSKDGTLIVNPTNTERAEGLLDLFVSGTADRINMIEAGAHEVAETDLVAACAQAQAEIAKIVAFEKSVVEKIGKKKSAVKVKESSKEFVDGVKKFLSARLEDAIYLTGKVERQNAMAAVKADLVAYIKESFPDSDAKEADAIYEEVVDEIVHVNIIKHNKRPDGRKLDEIRNLAGAAGLIKRTHGSGLFVRGNTQVLSLTTLAAPGQEQLVETMETTGKRRFMHHYNFPPYSVGETKPLRGPSRRDIGHGALAEKALRPMIPDTNDFPYTIRIVSETLSSNGSSSMASTCAGTLSLMDAGVPMKKPVGGIAMGLMTMGDVHKVLTDIQGPEDHYGDMDLKVAGTRDGVTAVQMDVKIDGITIPMLTEAVAQAKAARMQILDVMAAVLPAPRAELSPYAPRVYVLHINPDKIREVIGPGGKVINTIIAETQTTIDIEQDGTVYISGTDAKLADQAINWVKDIAKEFQVGEIVEGKIVRILEFGAILQISPRHDGMIHISEIAPQRVNRVEEFFQMGDTVKARIVKLDPETNRIGLSTKEFH